MPERTFEEADIKHVGALLNDSSKPLKERFRALFTLKNIGGQVSIEEIARCFSDRSDLLKHELAYCLGQMQDIRAIPSLTSVLNNEEQSVIVRHEAGEALGAIGCPSVLPLLQSYCLHEVPELAETCQLAVQRIQYLQCNKNTPSDEKDTFGSVDPAPPVNENDSVEKLEHILLDESLPLFERYRAMFALRNKCNDHSVLALAKGLKCSSALFRHEIAFVLGQIASPLSVACLKEALQDTSEKPMVRHEAAEALGAVATEECFDILKKYQLDGEVVVKESCEVALDMCEYENSEQFQYANALVK